MDHWVKVSEACDILGVSPNTLRRLVKEGRLQAYLIDGVRGYQFKREDVERLIIRVKPDDFNELENQLEE